MAFCRQNDICTAGGDVRAVLHRVSRTIKLGEGGVFDDESDEEAAHVAPSSWISLRGRPVAFFHSIRPLAERPSRTPAAVDGELNV